MHRAQRRRVVFRERGAPVAPGPLRRVPEAPRTRTARRIRGLLRRVERIALLTPRWSAPQAFLEDLALDLAVGEPGVACRTIGLRPLRGRTAPEAWNYLLRVLCDLDGDAAGRPVPVVCTRSGFQNASAWLLERAHHASPRPVALLAWDAHHLPVDVLDDLLEAWSSYQARVGDERRCGLLLAGGVDAPSFRHGLPYHLDLGDYAEAEAAATMVLQMGPLPMPVLQAAAHFSGGVPAIVHALGAGVAEQALMPEDAEAMFRCLGPMASEIRTAVSVALARPESAERFHALAAGGPLDEEPADAELVMAGLARRLRGGPGGRVELRSPALALAAG